MTIFDYSGILDITFKIERPVIKDKASESFTAVGVFDAAITGHEKINFPISCFLGNNNSHGFLRIPRWWR